MKRTHLLLGILAGAIVIASFWMFLLQPKRAEIAETRELVASVESRQQQLQVQITHLQQVRDEAPEAEAQLAAAAAIVPESAALPSLLRQLQLAADEAGLTLSSVTVGRPPEQIDAGVLSVPLPISLALEGGYYQIVDFLRRIEDPAITPRGVLWNSITVESDPEDYPTLTAALIGRTFADAGLVPPAPSEAAPSEEAGDGTEGDETEAADTDGEATVETDQ